MKKALSLSYAGENGVIRSVQDTNKHFPIGSWLYAVK